MSWVLRILTINTGKCDGPYRARLRWLSDELRRLQPDVVACQEAFCDVARELDTAGSLARDLGLALAWAPARFKARVCEGEERLGWSGMALLSRLPWLDVETLELPSDPRDGDRVAQIGVLNAGRAQVVIANIHLSHLRGCDELRRQELNVVLNHPIVKNATGPALLCGDFNSISDSPVLAPLLAAGSELSVRDAYREGGGSGDGATVPLADCDPEVWPRIDFILALAPRGSRHPVFTSSTVVLNRPHPESYIFPSDHFGVATTLLLLP